MGPLQGIKVLEFEAIGPGPFCGMVLADLGADVLVVDRPSDPGLGLGRGRNVEVMMRGKRSLTLDLKSQDGVAAAIALAARADALIEGFRPGVMERLGLGPDVLLKKNPKLVYGRMTGWGQDGPMAPRAGHDINYIALSGMLHAIGRAGQPPAPSGKGQVVDAAMVEGAGLLGAMFSGMLATKRWNEQARGVNLLDSGAPWYDAYETKDGRYVSIGSIESKFYADLLVRLGLDKESLPAQMDVAGWPTLRKRFGEVFRSKTRDEWCTAFEGSDACFAPVLTFSEARSHPHNVARRGYVEVGGIPQPAPAPRFSRTPGAVSRTPPERGEGGRAALADWGLGVADIEKLKKLGVGFAD